MKTCMLLPKGQSQDEGEASKALAIGCKIEEGTKKTQSSR